MSHKLVQIPIYIGIGIDGLTPQTHVLSFKVKVQKENKIPTTLLKETLHKKSHKMEIIKGPRNKEFYGASKRPETENRKDK